MNHVRQFCRLLANKRQRLAFGACAKAAALGLTLLGSGASPAQTTPTWPVVSVAPNAPSSVAIGYLLRQATASRNAPIILQRVPFTDPSELCTLLSEKQAAGLYIAPLAVYRTCYQGNLQLAALDFPYLARGWNELRGLLSGPFGTTVAAGLQRNQVEVLSFWDGDDRVLSSNRSIDTLAQLRGRKIAGPSTFASTTAFLEAGATPVQVATPDLHQAISRGVADTADTTLSTYRQDTANVHNTALLSNHALDPYVVAIPTKQWSELSATSRGFLESLLARATSVQVQAADTEREQLLSSAAQSGLLVQSMTETLRDSLRSPTLIEATEQRASQVFERSPAAFRTAALQQLRGQRHATYVTVRFATNRRVAAQGVSDDIEPDLRFGEAEVELRIQQGGVRPVEAQQEWIRHDRQGKGITVDWGKVSTTPPPAAFTNVPKQIPAKAPLLYVHGFANRFEDALTRGAWISWNAKRPVMVFAWPSQGRMWPENYRADQRTADQSAATLAELMRSLSSSAMGATDFDLVVHSMGARVTLTALDILHGHAGSPPLRFRQLIFVAPDVGSSHLASRWPELQRHFQRAATLYVSDHDRALGISREFMNPGEGPRAGLAPPVLVTDRVESMFVGRNDLSLLGHSYHVSDGPIADDLMEALRYGVGAADRRGVVGSLSGAHFELLRLRDP